MKRDWLVVALGVAGAVIAFLVTTVTQELGALIPILLAFLLIMLKVSRRRGVHVAAPRSMDECIVEQQAGSWQVYIRVGEDGWAAASGKKHLTRGGAETEAATLGYTVVEAP
jgi:hypothetical protein